jgi:hypothetical protein
MFVCLFVCLFAQPKPYAKCRKLFVRNLPPDLTNDEAAPPRPTPNPRFISCGADAMRRTNIHRM